MLQEGDSHLKVAMRTKEQSSKCCPPHQVGNDIANRRFTNNNQCFVSYNILQQK